MLSFHLPTRSEPDGDERKNEAKVVATSMGMGSSDVATTLTYVLLCFCYHDICHHGLLAVSLIGLMATAAS